MTWTDAMWLAIGAVIGVAHALGIWRSVTHVGATSALLGLVRLLTIALVLTASAVLGGLIPAALGWVAGFFATVVIVLILKGCIAVGRQWGRGRISS